MLSVYIDFKSAASYLALKPSLALRERHQLEIAWKPYQTQARDLPDQLENESVGQRHRRVRALSQRATWLKYAALQGVPLHFPERPGVTDLALGVLARLKTEDEQLRYIQAAFEAYWVAHADLNDPTFVTKLITQVKLAGALNEDSARAALTASQAHAEDLGVVDAPAYILADHLFIGREHLPWIEELIISDTTE